MECIAGPKVCPSVDPAPILLKGCVDAVTIEGETVTYDCSYEANYTNFKMLVNSYWIVAVPNQQSFHIDENSTIANYSVNVYEDCILNSEPCCQVTSSLHIKHVSALQNGTTVTCYAGMLSQLNNEIINSNANLSELCK